MVVPGNTMYLCAPLLPTVAWDTPCANCGCKGTTSEPDAEALSVRGPAMQYTGTKQVVLYSKAALQGHEGVVNDAPRAQQRPRTRTEESEHPYSVNMASIEQHWKQVVMEGATRLTIRFSHRCSLLERDLSDDDVLRLGITREDAVHGRLATLTSAFGARVIEVEGSTFWYNFVVQRGAASTRTSGYGYKMVIEAEYPPRAPSSQQSSGHEAPDCDP